MLRLFFLLHDARSGSTFLARQLHMEFANLVVTPEISLLYAIREFRDGRCDPGRLLKALDKGRFFETLQHDREHFQHYRPSTERKFANYVRDALGSYAKKNWPDRNVKAVVVKKGHHAWVTNRIVRIFGGDASICLYRDPRAVYEAKNRTLRPYRPHQTMGWAGTALTTLRWRQYTDAMLDAERLHGGFRVKYEDLALDRNAVLDRISGFITLPRSASVRDDYKINAREEGIHTRSRAQSIPISDLEDWRSRISPQELGIVELVAGKRMDALHYNRDNRTATVKTIFDTLASGVWGSTKLLQRRLPAASTPGRAVE